MRAMRVASWAMACWVTGWTLLGPASGAAAGPQPIGAEKVAAGLDQPVGFTFDPRGRIWYVEKAGAEVRILNLAKDTDRPFFRFSGVSSLGERGTLGIALHPDFPDPAFVYVFVTRRSGTDPLQNQIVRLRNDGGQARNPRIIFSSPTTSRTNHNGGRILFGPDEMLYAVVGDGGEDPGTAQDPNDVRGKVLRMTPTGTPAPGNPFGNLVYSTGLRNSFGFDFDPATDVLWESENGPECNDELNRIIPNENYGWGASFDCSTGAAPDNTNQDGTNPVLPLAWFTPTIAPTGVAFCDGCGLGLEAEGTFFLGSNNQDNIRQVTLNPARDDITDINVVHSEPQRVISLETAPGGSIYFSDLGGRIFRLVKG